MTNLTELQNLVDRFHANIDFYKDARNAYNEHSCRNILVELNILILC